jgi:uncharacterized damage-inducible protein DinB
MTTQQQLIDNLNYAFEKDNWAANAVLENLRDVSASEAAARPLDNAHSIWEIVLHMAVWKRVPRLRLEGSTHQPDDKEDWAEVTDTSPEAWERAKAALMDEHRKLVEAVKAADDAKLEEQVPEGGGLTHSRRIWGAIMHDNYHNGQIGILRKKLKSSNT